MMRNPKGVRGEERPPRLRLIRAFLSILVGFMGGLVGWMIVMLVIVFWQGTTTPALAQLPTLPPLFHAVAFAAPGAVAGYWFFTLLGSPR